MYLNTKDLETFRGEVLNDLSKDELMDSILAFLSSIFNYNNAVEQKLRVNVIDVFTPYVNVSAEELNIAGGGIDLTQLEVEELKELTVDSFICYTLAATGLQNNPMLPLIVDDNMSIRVIEHSV
jgi:hypothetical protein